MKKILSFMLILIFTTINLNIPVNANTLSNGTCGDNIVWSLDNNGILTISGTGTMTNANSSWYSYISSISSVVIGYGVTNICGYAFENCTNLTSVAIPSSVTSIEFNAFKNCNSLETIKIPEGVVSIGHNVFGNCTKLKNISLPSTVSSIGYTIFENCTNLQNISVSEENPYYCSYDGNLFNKHKSKMVFYAAGKIDDTYIIPETVVEIGHGAFYSCNNLQYIEIHDNVTYIDKYAFSYCKNLLEISLPNQIETISHSTFSYCDNLTKVSFSDKLTSIENYAFQYCTNLYDISAMPNVLNIGDGAFYGCHKLEQFIIPKNLETINNYVFSYCTNLKSITIPDGVTSIGYESFRDCKNLSYVIIPESIVKIGKGAFTNTSSNSNIVKVMYAGNRTKWNNISFGNNLSGLISATIIYGINNSNNIIKYEEKIVDEINIKLFLTTIENYSGHIVVAMYNNDNSLYNVKLYPVSQFVEISAKRDTFKYIRIMWWENLGAINPVCKTVDTEL